MMSRNLFIDKIPAAYMELTLRSAFCTFKESLDLKKRWIPSQKIIDTKGFQVLSIDLPEQTSCHEMAVSNLYSLCG